MQTSFNDLLKTSLENPESDEDNNNICLISHEPLTNNHIKLSCSHKFIYKHIFNEVELQKNNPNLLEIQKLKKFQFKCPYCRSVENGVLPWQAPFPQIYGINWPASQFIKINKCGYIFKSGKKKGKFCNSKCVDEYCKSHQRIIKNRNNKKTLNVKPSVQINKCKCQGITKKGTQCSRRPHAMTGGIYCMQHGKSYSQNIPSPLAQPFIPVENVIITI